MAAFKEGSSLEIWTDYRRMGQKPRSAHNTSMWQSELSQPRRAAKCQARNCSNNKRLHTSSSIVCPEKGAIKQENESFENSCLGRSRE